MDKIELRQEEILSMLTACENEKYKKEDLLPELLKLQDEMVELTFNKDHSSLAEFKIGKVVKHLKEMNEDNNFVASESFKKFKNDSWEISNQIRALISGNYGENKTFRRLEELNCKNVFLRNVELNDEGERVEIDALVITNKGIFLVEVKNSIKDILIDEEGRFFRIGKYRSFDCNIADKMADREFILRKTLEKAGIENINLHSILVFTNSNIYVTNNYEDIDISFLGKLPASIECYSGDDIYSDEDIESIKEAIKQARYSGEYEFDVDIKGYKESFAKTVALLEAASRGELQEEEMEEPTVIEDLKTVLSSKEVIGAAGAVAGILLVSALKAVKRK